MRLHVLVRLFLVISLYLTLGIIAILAQQTAGQITGTIFDSQGAALPGAEVTVTDPSTAFTRGTVSTASGAYSLPALPPGTYNLTIKAKGFTVLEQKGISLVVGQVLTLNQILKPGSASEVVEVTGEPPLVETSKTEIGGSVTPSEVTSLPILDRNFTELMTLVPGVRPAEAFDPTKTRVGNISVNGGDGRQLDIGVDGGDNKDLVVGGLVQNFPVEAIQEFNVVTDQYSAEPGHSVGGVANVIVKSGTNTLHGSALGLTQLSTLNRTNYFEKQNCLTATPAITDVSKCKSVFHRYDYAFSLGGPIIKDKLFAFGAFEQKREPGSIIAAPGVGSDLTTFASQTSGFSGGPYAFPAATLPFPYIDTLAAIRLDYKASDRQNLFLRYGRQKWTNPNDQLGNTNTPFTADSSQAQNDLNNFHDLTLGHNFTISANKVNSLNLHFQDMANAILPSPTHSFTYPVASGGTVTNPNILFSDGSQVGQNANVPQETLLRKYQLRDDFNWLHGKHNFKFGANDIYFAKFGGFFFFGANGYQARQDSYKVTPRFTVNAGLRWDANIGFLRPMLGNSLTNSNRTIWWLNQTAMAVGSTLESDPGLQQIQEIVHSKNDLNRTTADWKEFQSRIGFAWDVSGNGKNVIRGGYGIARDQIFQNITLFSVQQTQPTIYQTLFDYVSSAPPGGSCAPTAPFDICSFRFGIDPFPVPPPGTSAADITPGAVGRIVNPKITDPWSQQFSVGWSSQLSADYALSIDYYHTLGTHEERVLNANPTIKPVCDASFPGSNPLDPRCNPGAAAPTTRLMDLS